MDPIQICLQPLLGLKPPIGCNSGWFYIKTTTEGEENKNNNIGCLTHRNILSCYQKLLFQATERRADFVHEESAHSHTSGLTKMALKNTLKYQKCYTIAFKYLMTKHVILKLPHLQCSSYCIPRGGSETLHPAVTSLVFHVTVKINQHLSGI